MQMSVHMLSHSHDADMFTLALALLHHLTSTDVGACVMGGV